MYAFLFDRKSLILVGLGIFLACLLLFGAGLMVGAGVDRNADLGRLQARLQEHEVLPTRLSAPPPTDLALADTAYAEVSQAIPAGAPAETPGEAPPTTTAQPPSVTAATTTTSAVIPEPADQGSAVAATSPMTPSPSATPSSATPSSATPSSVATSPAAGSSAAGTFSVQVGAFRIRENADTRTTQLLQHGPYVEVVQNDQGDVLYSVRVGPFATRAEAEQEAGEICLELKQLDESIVEEEFLIRSGQDAVFRLACEIHG